MTDPTLALRGPTQYLAGQRKPTDVTVDGIGIDRLRTELLDVQPQNPLGEGSIALPKNLNVNGNAKTGERTSRFSGYVFFACTTDKCPSTETLSTAEANLKGIGRRDWA